MTGIMLVFVDFTNVQRLFGSFKHYMIRDFTLSQGYVNCSCNANLLFSTENSPIVS